jgi:phosphate acyltransferase
MRILLDVMGGDRPPQELVEGGIAAGRRLDVDLVFSGDPSLIRRALADAHERESERFAVLPATQTIEMNEPPVQAVRAKRDSSLANGLLALKHGDVDAFVSPGNTGAVVVGAILLVGRIAGIPRPALATPLPTLDGREILVLDVGANVDSQAEHLLHFARMGETYAREVSGVPKPTVGLLSNGTESGKGTRLNRRAFELLTRSALQFVGNVESHALLTEGPADVVVCDGFVGNVLLKAIEGGVVATGSLLKQGIASGGLRTKLGGLLLLPVFELLRERLAYERYGGAPLLGVNGVVVIAHGRSDAEAIGSAIEAATQAAKVRLTQRLAEGIQGWQINGN